MQRIDKYQRVEQESYDDDDIELDIEDVRGLSNDFFLDSTEVDISIEDSPRMYPSEPEISEYNSSYIVASNLVPSTDNSLSSPNKRKNKLLVDVIESVSPEVYKKNLSDTLMVTTGKLTNSLQELSTKLKFTDTMYLGNQLETLLKVSDKLGGKVNDSIIHELYRDKSVSARELFDRVYPNSSNEAEFLVFEKQFNSIRDIMKQEQDKNNYVSSINKKSSELLLIKILDLGLINRLFSYKGEFMFVRKFYSKGGLVTHFKCENCSDENHEVKQELDTFIYIINVASKDFSIILPLECKTCGTFHLLDPAVLKSISSKCSTISNSLKTTRTGNTKINFNSQRSIMNMSIYTANVDEVTSFLKDYNVESIIDLDDSEEVNLDEDFSVETVKVDTSLPEVDDNWEDIKQRFLDTITLIGDSKFKLVCSDTSDESIVDSDVEHAIDYETTPINDSSKLEYTPNRNFFNRKTSLSLKNITKIYASLGNSYPFLKKMAVASTISLLKPLGLTRFSLNSKSFYKVYSLLGDLDSLQEKDLVFLSEELGFRIYNSEGNVDKEVSDLLFKDIEFMNNNFDSEKSKFIDSLYNNLYFLSYMPISSDKITDEDVNDYLYDEDIRTLIDRVSDLMILNNLAEDWLNRFNPALKNDTGSLAIISKRTVSNSVTEMKKVDRRTPLRELFFKVASVVTGSEVESLLRFVDSADSLNYLCLFLNACYKRDLYDMYRYYPRIVYNRISSPFKELESLYNLLSKFKSEELYCDKFSFYFPTIDCGNRYKPRFVKLFEEKGFVPNDLDGEDIDEILDNYSKMSYSEDTVNFIPRYVDELLKEFSDTIKFGRFISSSNLFKDFGVYYSARDLLYSLVMKNVPLEDILNSLNLSPELASMLIEENYNMPNPDSLVVKYADLLNLPLDGSLEVPVGSYKEKIMFILDNFDEVKPMFKSFPGIYDLVVRIGDEE